MKSKHRWFVLAVFYGFILLHQADKLLISPLTTPIMADFKINQAQMGAVSSFAIIVAAVLYPVWGYLYDRFARAKLLALASFIWGSTTWLNALARTYGVFLVTRASTGIDDSSYPGIYSLLSDYFGPNVRGKVYGALETAQPFGYMLGLILATSLGAVLGWRNVFFITGSVGLVLAVIIFFGVREARRGRSEPEMANLAEVPRTRFSWQVARELLRTPSMKLLFVQGFFGVFPWNVLTFWFFRYLEVERGFSSGEAMVTMMIAIIALAGGYFVGGLLGDIAFRRTLRGRVLTAMGGVLTGAILLLIVMNVPTTNRLPFMILMGFTGLMMSMAAPNVAATLHDIAEPEVRSTAQSLTSFVENTGAALAPWLAGLIADRWSLKVAILAICVITWIFCAIAFGVLARFIPADVRRLRATMRQRAAQAEKESLTGQLNVPSSTQLGKVN
jgi:MFS transporter, Spinster family, sphingosine-1-phosphate transporter